MATYGVLKCRDCGTTSDNVKAEFSIVLNARCNVAVRTSDERPGAPELGYNVDIVQGISGNSRAGLDAENAEVTCPECGSSGTFLEVFDVLFQCASCYDPVMIDAFCTHNGRMQCVKCHKRYHYSSADDTYTCDDCYANQYCTHPNNITAKARIKKKKSSRPPKVVYRDRRPDNWAFEIPEGILDPEE